MASCTVVVKKLNLSVCTAQPISGWSTLAFYTSISVLKKTTRFKHWLLAVTPAMHTCVRAVFGQRQSYNFALLPPAVFTAAGTPTWQGNILSASTYTLPLATFAYSTCHAPLPSPDTSWCRASSAQRSSKLNIPASGDDTREGDLRVGAAETAYFNSVSYNKRSVTPDLQTAESQ